MLAIQACYGTELACPLDKLLGSALEVDVFAKMSNKYLGKMVLPSNLHDTCLFECVFDVVRNLQRQGAKLLRHSERPCQYLKLFLDQQELPCLAYHTRDDAIPCVARVVKALQGATRESRIDLLWDEDDTFASDVICEYVSVEEDTVFVEAPPDVIKYASVLAFTHRPTRLRLELEHDYKNRIDVDFLVYMKQLYELELINIRPTSWNFMKLLDIKVLSLHYVDVDDDALQAFKHVDRFKLVCQHGVGFEAQSLERLSSLQSLKVTVLDYLGRNRAAMDAWASKLVLQDFYKKIWNSSYTWELRASRT